MNHEADYAPAGSSGNGKLRQWLIDQVNSGGYQGLVWEDGGKSIFRIPWKHAGKQDYNRDEDAALFKAWALFKGKFREGVDKADPPTWKTRLRCALNKSNDFEELLERSQLDISDPYKVYRVIPEDAKRRPRQEDSPLSPASYSPYPTLPSQCVQMPPYMPGPLECGGSWREFYPEQAASHPDLHIPQCPYPPHPWGGPPMDNAYQIKGSFYSYKHADLQPSAFTLDPGVRTTETLSDLRLLVSVFHRDALVREVTSSNPKGCQLVRWPQEEKAAYVAPGGPDLIPLPPDGASPRGRSGSDEPPPEPLGAGGVRLWMTPDGVFARRLGQESVYWRVGLGPHAEKLHHMERDVSCKLLDTQDFLTEFQGYGFTGRPTPPFQAVLCFGDECVDPERSRRTLSVQVEPLFAKQLFYCAQPSGGHYYRGYEHHGAVPEHPSDAFRQALTDRYHSMMQE